MLIRLVHIAEQKTSPGWNFLEKEREREQNKGKGKEKKKKEYENDDRLEKKKKKYQGTTRPDVLEMADLRN
jgi:hypothetical protein